MIRTKTNQLPVLWKEKQIIFSSSGKERKNGLENEGHLYTRDREQSVSPVHHIPLLVVRFMSVKFQLGEKNAINVFIGTTLFVEGSEKLATEISIPIRLFLYPKFYPVVEFFCVCSFPMFLCYYRGYLNVKIFDGIKQ